MVRITDSPIMTLAVDCELEAITQPTVLGRLSTGGILAPRLYNIFHAQLRLKFILLINVKMPTIVGILTFISRINYRLW